MRRKMEGVIPSLWLLYPCVADVLTHALSHLNRYQCHNNLLSARQPPTPTHPTTTKKGERERDSTVRNL